MVVILLTIINGEKSMFKELPKVVLFVVIISYSFDMSRVGSLEKRLTVLEQKVEILYKQINQNQKEKIFWRNNSKENGSVNPLCTC